MRRLQSEWGTVPRMVVLLLLAVALNGALKLVPVHGVASKLSPDFYSRSCPRLEPVVEGIVSSHVRRELGVAASLLRLHFHDCFVQGCDGSVLLESTPNSPSEKTAVPNQTLRELHVIDEIKGEVESMCPGVVSCADILALAARDAVVQSGGPTWAVELGRLDGRTSSAAEANAHLPSSQMNAQALIDAFAGLGLDVRDLVTLSGGHSIGKAHCFQVSRRFYDWPGSRMGVDPTLDPAYAQQLKRACPLPVNPHTRVPNDPLTPDIFDPLYYRDVLADKGLFSSDSALARDNRTRAMVEEYARNAAAFFRHFGRSMIKMGRIISDKQAGEVRKRCAFVN